MKLILYILKSLFWKYRSVFKFILTFLLVYTISSAAYKMYLDYSDGSRYYPDYVTNLVAKQSRSILEILGYEADIMPHPREASMKLIINKKFVARIIEGCNSISAIILFSSFIIAFASRLKPTLLYLIFGIVLIYVVNLFRVVILSIGLYNYPWRREILHSVIFPLIIYGLVFLLWMLWVNLFAKLKSRNV